MSNNTKAISFWDFLKENTLEIPIIQRDYAQGRLGKENLRKNFLADLKNQFVAILIQSCLSSRYDLLCR